MTVDDFARRGEELDCRAPRIRRWKRPYTELTYQPMQEVLSYLRANGYKTYIVTGGGQDFVRVYAEKTYGIPPEQVVGTAGVTSYGYDKDGKPFLTKEPKLLLNDNNAGKPEGIHLMIGQRPHAAFGNSTGDRQMLEYTTAGDGARLAMLVLHDDADARICLRPGRGPARHQGRHLHAGSLRRGQEGRLDRHQHEERLEAHLRIRAMNRRNRESIQGRAPSGGNDMRKWLAIVLPDLRRHSPCSATGASAQTSKPNILIIWGDDIGYWNLSAYNHGMMGYKTPNIDRIAKEGALFTDYYGQQSCTAGRAAFITGQTPFRTGLLKVGLPGAKEGLQKEDVTLAELLKAQGYVTGQFGKNHLGDLDEHLPTVHGFDEFYGSLYHLNAEEEPENPDYPKDPAFKDKFGPRGVLHTWANPDGTQRIENTGALTKKRMETVDEEFTDGGDRLHEQGQERRTSRSSSGGTRPACTSGRISRRSREGKTGLGVYPDGMVEHDAHGRRAARHARRARHRRQHHRHVFDRQRRREVHLARRRHVTLPRREEHQLGRRLPRARARPLARHDQAGHGLQRHRGA